ncbi:MAG: hypothetical protein ACD_79C00553G0004 [uncultured bacterium]|nr:MAG: hypothetical protein ACD_79C00553G0004 [uncultured bacterium]
MGINEHLETVCNEVWKQEVKFCNYLTYINFLLPCITVTIKILFESM